MVRQEDEVLRSGTVSLDNAGTVYTARYDVLPAGRGRVVVRLQTGQAAAPGGFTEEEIAGILLREIVDSGLADREGLGRPAQTTS